MTEKMRRESGFSMIEILVAISLMSVLTAVLLQSFIVARRLNARASTEQRLQTLAESTMESMKAASLSMKELTQAARDGRTITIDGIPYHAEQSEGAIRLLYNDVGNGRGPVVSFGKQYGVFCLIDPTPYQEKQRANSGRGTDLVASFNNRDRSSDDGEELVQLSVVVYLMEKHLDKTGEE
ncbi:MAG: type II secretion system protein, partial [Lachnospiraceae bacterium]|nr:type II secretion system protein [Lachnospiraceae bacterium]